MGNKNTQAAVRSRIDTSKRYIMVFKSPKTVLVLASFFLVALSGAASYATLRGAEPSLTVGDEIAIHSDVAQVADSTVTDARQKTGQKKTEPVPALPNPPPAAPTAIQPVTSGLVNGMLLYSENYLTGKIPQLADQPVSRWFGGWNSPVDAGALVSAAEAQGSVATVVLYNIPSRDCGSYSAGGLNSSESYRSWVRQIAASMGMRKAIVILEPDALPGMDCLSTEDQDKRYADLADAVNVFASQTKASVYLDAGNYSWQSADMMTGRLQRANVAGATGFSLNVSGFGWTNDSIAYGDHIASRLGKTYVIDTSRNGNGPAPGNEWCNPRGRALGARPTTNTASQYADAYLWVKVPGESDGECNSGPSAGVWWQEYADELVRNAGL